MGGFDTRDLLADVGDEWPDLEELDFGEDADENDAPPPLEAA